MDPLAKAHSPYKLGDVGTCEQYSNLGISPLMMVTVGDHISQVKLKTIDHAQQIDYSGVILASCQTLTKKIMNVPE